MAISYNKLWEFLVDKKMSKADLRKAAGIAPNTMTRLRRDEEVTLTVLHILPLSPFLELKIRQLWRCILLQTKGKANGLLLRMLSIYLSISLKFLRIVAR